MNTFKDLYLFLQEYSEDNILGWLEQPWDGKDKQESLLRLFAGLKVLPKVNEYNMCKGNFNLKTIEEHKSFKDIFYNNEYKLKSLKDKGDSSDLTGIHITDKKHLLLTTSKNMNKVNVGKLDIDKILTNFSQYDGYTYTLCLVLRDKHSFKVEKIEKTNKELKTIIQNNTIVIDWDDLNEAYHFFKSSFETIKFEDICDGDKQPLCLKMHQRYSVMRTIQLKNNHNKVLWGHIQRSGKSYIMAGTIIEDCKNKEKCNYLILTTVPNETIEQYIKVMKCLQLSSFNIVYLNRVNRKPKLTNKNIIICSKQYLQSKLDKTRKIVWLKKLNFDIRFVDETHYGGTTILAQQTLEYYGNNTFTVYVTATYSKPICHYNIPKQCWILWDLEDIKLCKNIDNNYNAMILEEKYKGIDVILKMFSKDNIKLEYSKYPELWILTENIEPDIATTIVNNTKETKYGYSIKSSFLLKQGCENGNKKLIQEFQNEEEALKVWYRVFGKKNEFNIPDKEYPDKNVFIKRIESICKNSKINSRFIGDCNEPSIIMAFLPQMNIEILSIAIKMLLEKHNVVPDYEIICLNSKVTSNPKQTIEDARVRAKHDNKKGVLVLSGKQCSIGVTIPYCDIVILLNNTKQYDMLHQMIYRSMTEDVNKKCGFVIDMNIHRSIEISIEYAYTIKPNMESKKAIQYLLQERIINLNADHYRPEFGKAFSRIQETCEFLYNNYISNTENIVKKLIKRLEFKTIDLTLQEKKMFNRMFTNVRSSHKEKVLRKTIMKKSTKVKVGIETNEIQKDDDVTEKEEHSINYMVILTQIIPLICLLTIHEKTFNFIEMFDIVKNNKYTCEIFEDQIKNWWGSNINSETIIEVYRKYLKKDEQVNLVIKTIKEIFVKNTTHPNKLSSIIDEYLSPLEVEKEKYAEISTPYKLRQEMLDKIPDNFWMSEKKVFEPASGKGGFILDIISKFMSGLDEIIVNENERYKVIVERCIYFSDINPTNLFITKLLVDPYNKYNLNFNEGNTLLLNTKEKWNLDKFDAVIGNPPYNSGNIGSGNSLWQKFTKTALNTWLKDDGYLLFVHPPGWRKPCYPKSQMKGLYELMVSKNQMIYLSIHNVKDGKEIFKCGTRYDWYLIQKTECIKETIVVDENRETSSILLSSLNWLPNSKYEIVLKILDNKNSLTVIMDSSYHAIRDYVSDTKDEEFKYTLIHSTPKTGVRYKYSKLNDKGHFNIPKLIFGEAGINHVIIDMNGEYGMTQGAIGIIVENIEEAENIKQGLLSEKFKEVLKSCSWSNFRIDARLFTSFRKDFWKYM